MSFFWFTCLNLFPQQPRYTPRTREKSKIAGAGILSSLSGSRVTSTATTQANNMTLR